MGENVGNQDVEEDAVDPLELHKLLLSFDYLMFKIKDDIANLTDQTYRSIIQKQKLIDEDYLQDQLHLQQELEYCDLLLRKCDQLETDFSKLQQLYLFVDSFKICLARLETEFEQLDQTH
jgi:hypothetical protein